MPLTFFRSWRRAGLLLILLCACVYLPGLFSLPPIDRDESRFALASWQMAQHSLTEGEWGGWVVPRIQDKPRLNKPPLIYWLQAGCWKLLGSESLSNGGIWVFRIPSVLAATLTVLLTWRLGVGGRMFDPRAALLGAAMLAVCPLVVFDAHQARADQLLLLTVVASQYALWQIYRTSGVRREASVAEDIQGAERATPRAPAARGPRPAASGTQVRDHRRDPWTWPILFWLSIGAGIMTKGPITPMIAGLTVLSLCLVERRTRLIRDLKLWLGVPIVVAMVLPWVAAVAHQLNDPAQQRLLGLAPSDAAPISGWTAYAHLVYDETIGRSASAKEGHWGPPGYHLVLLPVLFWPGSLLTALAIKRAWKRVFRETGCVTPSRVGAKRPVSRGNPELFLLAWLIPSWLVFELIGTKLPHYTMPLYPAVALLSARALLAASVFRGTGVSPEQSPESGAWSLSARLGYIIWIMIGAVLALMPLALLAWSVRYNTNATLDWLGTHLSAIVALVVGVLILFVGLIISAAALWKRNLLRAQFASILAAVGLALATMQGALSAAPALWTSSHLVESRPIFNTPGSPPPIGLVGYHEDSLLFLLRGNAVRLNKAGLHTFIAEHPDSPLVLPADAPVPDGFVVTRTYNGFNYSTGKAVHLQVAEPAP